MERDEGHRNGNVGIYGRRKDGAADVKVKRSGGVDAVRTGEQVDEDRMRGMRGNTRGCFSCSLFKESKVFQIQEKMFY